MRRQEPRQIDHRQKPKRREPRHLLLRGIPRFESVPELIAHLSETQRTGREAYPIYAVQRSYLRGSTVKAHKQSQRVAQLPQPMPTADVHGGNVRLLGLCFDKKGQFHPSRLGRSLYSQNLVDSGQAILSSYPGTCIKRLLERLVNGTSHTCATPSAMTRQQRPASHCVIMQKGGKPK